MKHKTLFILSIPPPYGGGEIVSQILYEQLRNEENYYFSLCSKKKYNKSKQANTNFYSFYYSFLYILINIYRIIKINPDFVYIGLPKRFTSFLRNAIIIWVAIILNKNIYGEIHGMSFPFINDSNLKRKILLKTINKIDSIRVLSHSIKDYLVKIGYKGRIKVISNGIIQPAEINYQKQNFEKLNILYFGAISKEKGFKRVLDIFSSLNRDYCNKIQLNVIGEWVHNDERYNFSEFISNHDLFDVIIFHGKKIDNEKWKLIRENDIMLHLTSFDGQPLTIIETMSLGIPTIATKVGAIPEMIINRENGFLIDSNSDVKTIIEKIIDNQIDLQSLSKKAEETYLLNYTPEVMVNGIKQMINKLDATTNPTT